MTGGSIPGRDNDGFFLLCHCVQTDSEAHPASCSMGIRASFPGGKAAVT